ncbi:MAG: translation initiation factor IF-2 N-terminal domain-containing protein, partial [Melioribacteraceae bacterium]|nr:translation initiation factor IF-2 N-terminal domain-containing protein [Melioribacteraceae bacterium]
MATTKKPKKYRVYKYASEINISTDAIIDFLKSKDFEVKNHMALLSEEMLSDIQSHFKKDIDKSDEHKRKLAKFNEARAEKETSEEEIEVVEEVPVEAEADEVEEESSVEADEVEEEVISEEVQTEEEIVKEIDEVENEIVAD